MSEVHPCGRRAGRCCHGPNKHFLEDMCWVLCQKVGTQQWNTKTWSRSATPSRILAPCDPNQSKTCNSQFSTYCCKRKNFLLQPCLGGIKFVCLVPLHWFHPPEADEKYHDPYRNSVRQAFPDLPDSFFTDQNEMDFMNHLQHGSANYTLSGVS